MPGSISNSSDPEAPVAIHWKDSRVLGNHHGSVPWYGATNTVKDMIAQIREFVATEPDDKIGDLVVLALTLAPTITLTLTVIHSFDGLNS